MDNDTLWDKENGKRPVILLKDAKPETYVVLDSEGFLYSIGDAGTAKRVVEAKDESWREKPYDKVEDYEKNNEKLQEAKDEDKIKTIRKERKTRFLLEDRFGTVHINWEDSLIQAILSDNVREFIDLSSEPSFDPNKEFGALLVLLNSWLYVDPKHVLNMQFQQTVINLTTILLSMQSSVKILK